MNKITGYFDEFGLMCLSPIVINPDNKLYTGNIKAVIDTGAANSHIKQDLIDFLQLSSIEKRRFSHPVSGSSEVESYNVLISLHSEINLIQTAVLTLPHQAYPAELILGMNILRNFDIHFFSKEYRFELIHQT